MGTVTSGLLADVEGEKLGIDGEIKDVQLIIVGW
jgi:hypothetical protein